MTNLVAITVKATDSSDYAAIKASAAKAGAIFQASMSSGKFHGMIWPQTPRGW